MSAAADTDGSGFESQVRYHLTWLLNLITRICYQILGQLDHSCMSSEHHKSLH